MIAALPSKSKQRQLRQLQQVQQRQVGSGFGRLAPVGPQQPQQRERRQRGAGSRTVERVIARRRVPAQRVKQQGAGKRCGQPACRLPGGGQVFCGGKTAKACPQRQRHGEHQTVPKQTVFTALKTLRRGNPDGSGAEGRQHDQTRQQTMLRPDGNARPQHGAQKRQQHQRGLAGMAPVRLPAGGSQQQKGQHLQQQRGIRTAPGVAKAGDGGKGSRQRARQQERGAKVFRLL